MTAPAASRQSVAVRRMLYSTGFGGRRGLAAATAGRGRRAAETIGSAVRRPRAESYPAVTGEHPQAGPFVPNFGRTSLILVGRFTGVLTNSCASRHIERMESSGAGSLGSLRDRNRRQLADALRPRGSANRADAA